MQKIAVTGVAGLIGSHLLDELLARGYLVVGVDNLSYGKLENIAHQLEHERFSFHRVDVRDGGSLNVLANGCDAIVHLAAVKKVGEDQSAMETLLVNTTGTFNVLEAARIQGCKVLHASTSDVYGMAPELPFQEDGDLVLGPSRLRRWSYSVSKLYDEHLCFAYYHDYGVPTVVLRYFGAFSPRSSFMWTGGHVPMFIDAVLDDREIVIHGDGSQTRSMSHVSDVVDGTMRALESRQTAGEVFNLGSDEELSILATAHLIHELAATGRPLRTKLVSFDEVFGKGYKDIMRRVPDLTKSRDVLGYRPKVAFREAVAQTIDTIRRQRRSVAE